MAVSTFPADAFLVEGDPEAVRESGRSYGRFAGIAAEAAPGLRGLDSGGAWAGSEGDLFRAQVAEPPPHLDTAHGAFGQVALALDGFAEALAVAQRQMTDVRVEAEQTFGSLAGARADQAGLRAPSDGEVAADPAAQAAYEARREVLEARIGRLRASWEEQLAAAGGVRARLLEAAGQAGGTIRAAARTSPTANQGWLEDRWEETRQWASERVDELKGFMAEHAAALRSVAKALRVVGVALVAVGAVLAVFGCDVTSAPRGAWSRIIPTAREFRNAGSIVTDSQRAWKICCSRGQELCTCGTAGARARAGCRWRMSSWGGLPSPAGYSSERLRSWDPRLKEVRAFR